MNDAPMTVAELARSSDGEITPEQEADYFREMRKGEAEDQQALLDELLEDEPDLRLLAAWVTFQHGGTDLLGVDTSGPVPWVPGAEGIIRAEERQMWVANFGEGKTQAAVQFAAQVCQAGGHVIYLDVENDTREMAERLQPVVASLGDCRTRDRLAYRTDADLLTDESKLSELAGALPTADLLIIDSLTRVLASLGVDENSNRDIADFTRKFVDVISKQAKLAVLILDNTGHEGTRARGAVSKAALVEAVYAISGGKGVTEDKHGTLTLKRTRSRSGKLAPWVTASAGGGSYGPLITQEGDAPSGGEASVKKAAAMKAIVEHMTGKPDEPFSAKQLEPVAGAKRKAIQGYMQQLINEGTVERVQLEGVEHRWQALSPA